MSEELAGQVAPAVSSEAAPPATATEQNPAVTTSAQTDGADGGNESPVPKTLTLTEEELRDRIERATAKAAAKAERRAFREARDMLGRSQQPQPTAQQPAEGRPQRSQYANEDAYFDALTDWKLEQRDRAAQESKRQQETKSLVDKTEKLYAEAAKEPGFDREAFDELLETQGLSAQSIHTLLESDVAPKLMAFMSSNPDEVERIAKLSPARQAAELGKLEVKLQAAPKTTNAPRPIEPVGTRGTGTPSLENADFETYKKLRAKQGARWAN